MFGTYYQKKAFTFSDQKILYIQFCIFYPCFRVMSLNVSALKHTAWIFFIDLLITFQGKLNDILGMILVNSQDLFRCNLEGVNIVLPQFVTALEMILCDKDSRSQLSTVTSVEVRRSAIQILLSILPLPLQFKV